MLGNDMHDIEFINLLIFVLEWSKLCHHMDHAHFIQATFPTDYCRPEELEINYKHSIETIIIIKKLIDNSHSTTFA